MPAQKIYLWIKLFILFRLVSDRKPHSFQIKQVLTHLFLKDDETEEQDYRNWLEDCDCSTDGRPHGHYDHQLYGIRTALSENRAT